MITALCIQKFRDNNGKLIGYRLKDTKGNTQDFLSDDLKQAIRTNQIQVINLTLTSDNRLVDAANTNQLLDEKTSKIPKNVFKFKDKYPTDEELKNILTYAKYKNYLIKEVDTYCKHKIYIISKTEKEHIVVIPSNVTEINETRTFSLFLPTESRFAANSTELRKLQGNIRVFGASGLIGCAGLFALCNYNTLDLRCMDIRKVDTCISLFNSSKFRYLELPDFTESKIRNMKSMFENCKISDFNEYKIETPEVVCMDSMFEGCTARHLDLCYFKTSKVTSMLSIFKGAKATKINVSSFNTSNVTDMSLMFAGCKLESLYLSNFDTYKVERMIGMFYKAEIQSIDLHSFDTGSVYDMSFMFKGCKTNNLYIRNFDTYNVTNMDEMFKNCTVKYLDTRNFLLHKVRSKKDMFKNCRALIKTATGVIDQRTAEEIERANTVDFIERMIALSDIMQ